MGTTIVIIFFVVVVVGGVMWGRYTIKKDIARIQNEEEQMEKLHKLQN